MAQPETFTKLEDLQKRLGEMLVQGSLYRKLAYRQEGCHVQQLGQQRGSSLPARLHMFCDAELCEKETWWEVNEANFIFGSNFINRRTYRCKNCESNTVHYQFIWREPDRGKGLFMKVGQYPALVIEPSPELAKALGEEDAELYKKALINANFSNGIGAVAYFRRVLENKVNLLLDLIAEAARNAQVGEEFLKEFEAVKAGRVLDKKIEYAAKLLPSHLRPGGHNPLDKLYGAASVGLHGESDEECLNIFNDWRFVFEYLFKNLTTGNEEAREYVRRLSSR